MLQIAVAAGLSTGRLTRSPTCVCSGAPKYCLHANHGHEASCLSMQCITDWWCMCTCSSSFACISNSSTCHLDINWLSHYLKALHPENGQTCSSGKQRLAGLSQQHVGPVPLKLDNPKIACIACTVGHARCSYEIRAPYHCLVEASCELCLAFHWVFVAIHVTA